MISLLRLRLLAALLLGGTVVACVGERDPGPAPDASVEPTAEGTEVTMEGVPTAPAWVAEPGGPTLFEHVTEYARLRARTPYRPPVPVVSRTVSELDYVQYRGVQFRSDRAIWSGGSRFEVHLFHPGGGNDRPVRIHLVESGRSTPLDFDPALFRYGDEVSGLDLDVPPEAGYAGFKVLFPLNDERRLDEVVSFLGASYFRLLGPGHVYGLSSRGLAVDVARPEGEEFPDFVEFWLERPDLEADRMIVVALLDGPSVTGAYHFQLAPGGESRPTMMEVEARLFARTDVGKLGVAPLTSMYLHGTFDRGGDDDVRPRVHDSEGLLMRTGRGEWIWRPLSNGAGIRLTSLRDRTPSGFGLVQRDRDFDNYLDLEARYDRRPSEWVQILGDWGSGGVELLEIPTRSEFNDNVVASWVPDEPFQAGDGRTYRYRLVTFDDRLDTELDGTPGEGQTLAQVARTRIGWDALPGQADAPPRSRRRIVIDFEGEGLAGLAEDAALIADVGTSSGQISDVRIQSLPAGGRRVTFALTPEADRGADMRVYLRLDDQPVSETWSYLWEPERVP